MLAPIKLKLLNNSETVKTSQKENLRPEGGRSSAERRATRVRSAILCDGWSGELSEIQWK